MKTETSMKVIIDITLIEGNKDYIETMDCTIDLETEWEIGRYMELKDSMKIFVEAMLKKQEKRMESNGKDQQNEEIIEGVLEENTGKQVELNKRKRNDEENHENERERVKRKRTESKGFKRILRELRNEAYEMEVEEENDNEKLSERVLSMERKTIKYCYEIGKDITNEVQRIKEQEKGKMKERKKKNGGTVEDISKEILIDEIMKEIGNSVKRKIIGNRIRKAERIYNLFRKIGENKMKRIIESMITDFERLKNEEIDRIIEEFSKEFNKVLEEIRELIEELKDKPKKNELIIRVSIIELEKIGEIMKGKRDKKYSILRKEWLKTFEN
ncbi:hypothetical protein C1645_822596 [Glomus cerebriforme]|uniref:Uncharacterized protein n=1 Tax=Glomus cerebriforme TaxID=658196 RepID=A0A397SZK6_9GLOM|nr:hypothetical protein C1645_822596 [Glomus cerebriforme]